MTPPTSTSTQRVKDLFALPETIHRIEFVEQLGRAVERPKTTADTYVVTPALLAGFDRALGLVGSALRDGRSRAAFLHGSFGSGKSHFMALVSLLLDGNEEAWRVPELHALREKHPFVGNKKLLQLRFHMVGNSGNLEHAIFGRYLDAIRTRHPGADLPGVFADEKLFADARRMLDELGDEAFFAPMNEGVKKADEWGSFGAGEAWDRTAFEAAMTSTDPEQRARLFNALAKTRFRAYAEESRQFIDLDAGLAVIGRHVKGLGYDAVVLFLDELILWLASRASDVAWFHNEVQKLVKLVESQESRREVPFISFIARQRDLAEMVGRDYAGLENALVRDSLKWSEGRYETITLEDRNLPAIAEKRVLRARDDTARKSLDDAFKAMRTKLGDAAWTVLLGELDEKEFRRLYPFTVLKRREIIDALRVGAVPRRGLEYFAVGLERFEKAIEDELETVAAGHGRFKAVRGEYGTGKTFFARWLEHRALERGFATTLVQISESDTPLYRMETVYRRAVEALQTKEWSDGAFRSLIDRWFFQLEDEVLAQGGVCGRDVQRIGLSATVGNPDEILRWVRGSSKRDGVVVDPGGAKKRAELSIDYVGGLENAAQVIRALHPGRKRLSVPFR